MGLGKTGYSTAKALLRRGANVRVSEPSETSEKLKTATELRNLGIEVVFGEQNPALVQDANLIVPSPGIPNTNPVIESAVNKGIEVISEVELSYRLDDSLKIIGVTGTNGKTSVTTMISEVLNKGGIESISAGNIGNPLIDHAGSLRNNMVFVVELSSFQLQNTRYFKPWIGTILNIAEDHIDWHGSLKAYSAAKWKLFANQSSSEYAVINMDDKISKETKPDIASTLATFSPAGNNADFYLENDTIISKDSVISLANAKLFGKHNRENFLAVTAIASLAGIEPDVIEEVINGFEGLEHRITPVCKINGATYFDDSKATNPHAAMSAIEAFEGKPLVLLMGGKNKGNDFKALAHLAARKAKKVLLFGESASDIASAFPAEKTPAVFGTMAEAVKAARKMARDGDNILLSPACASFDEFNDYKHRGAVFKEVVCEDL